jgi:hypothetical protein
MIYGGIIERIGKTISDFKILEKFSDFVRNGGCGWRLL